MIQKNTSVSGMREKKTKQFRMSGITTMGKLASLIATKDGIELRKLPLLWMVLALWVCASILFVLSLWLGTMLLGMLVTFLGGFGAYISTMYLVPGRLMARYDYAEVISFVLDSQEVSLNTTDGKYTTIRLSDKKQPKLIAGINTMLLQSETYHFEQNGQYFRIKPNQSQEAPPPPPAGTPPKSKKAILATQARAAEARQQAVNQHNKTV